jgi:hypothetical protein
MPIALNMLSKILAFATVLCLFLPLRTPTDSAEPASADSAGHAVTGSAGTG